MSSLGDQPLARKRGRKNAAQNEAEQGQLTRKAHQVERQTAYDGAYPQASQGILTLQQNNDAAALGELVGMISDVAWLRIIPLHAEGVTHWYVKWNKGRWANHYIYYGQRASDTFRDAVVFLAIRFGEVESGQRKPHRDARYSGN